MLLSPGNKAFLSAENRARLFWGEKNLQTSALLFLQRDIKSEKKQKKTIKIECFLHKLSKCSVHQFESTDSVEAEARPDVESQTAAAAEAIANSPLVVIAPPWKLPCVPCCQLRGFAHAPSSTTSKTNHISLKEQNELELWVNPVSVGWGRRCRSTPSTGRRFQTVTATAAGTAPRFSCTFHTLEWYIKIFFKK